MHELSVAESMLDLVADRLGGPRPLVAATARVGVLSGVDPQALEFAFPEAAEALGFGRPALEIRTVPARAVCRACAAAYAMHDAFAVCPQCGALERTLEGGDDLCLESVEVEEIPHEPHVP